MKIFKYSVLFAIISLCFILHSETVQNNADTFTEDFYYINVYVPKGQEQQFFKDISSASERYRTGVFLCDKANDGMTSTKIDVYASDEAWELLKKRYNIYSTTYKSLFSGNTEITVNDIEKCSDDYQDYQVFLTRDHKTGLCIREALSKHFSPSYVKTQKNSTLNTLPFLLWALAIAFIMILFFIDCQYSKKEWFLRISLGERKISVFIKEILKDSFFLVFILTGVAFLLREHVYIGRNIIVPAVAVGIAVIFNILLHLTIFNADYKEIIYGANVNSHTASDCYVLKALIMIVATISISSNILLISNNYESFRQYNKLNSVQDQKIVKIGSEKLSYISPEEIQRIQETESLFFTDFFNQGKVTLSTKVSTKNNTFVFINKNAVSFVSGKEVTSLINNEVSLGVIVPDDLEMTADIQEEMKGYLFDFFNEELKDDFNTARYKKASALYIDMNNSRSGALGYGVENNPIFIVYNSPQSASFAGHLSGIFNDFVFSISDEEIKDFSEKYDLVSKGIKIESESVSDRLGELKSLFLRKILLNSATALLLLFVDMLMLSVMVNLDYRVNAMELSLKKIFGYTVMEKNRKILLLSSYAAAIGTATAATTSIMFSFAKWWIVAVTGVAILCFEFLFIFVNIRKVERENVSRILKGGSL